MHSARLQSRLDMVRAAFSQGAIAAGDGRATDLAREATDLVHAQDKPLGEILPAACSLAEQAAALHAAFAGLAGVICSLDVI